MGRFLDVGEYRSRRVPSLTVGARLPLDWPQVEARLRGRRINGDARVSTAPCGSRLVGLARSACARFSNNFTSSDSSSESK